MSRTRSNDFIPDFDPEWLKYLTPEERDIFDTSLRRLVGGETLAEYISRITPAEPAPRHVTQILDALQYARIKPVRIVFDLGPGHAKTHTLMKGIAWWLDPQNSPADLCAYISYSDAQARSKSKLVKEFMEAAGAKGKLAEASNGNAGASGHWQTARGGGLVAKGSKGGLMGKRIPGLLVYDDPYKDAQEARSQAVNSMIIERFRAAAFTRLQGGSIFVLHTRWRDDDLIGWILKNLKWDHVHIPTVCEEVDPKTGVDAIGRVIGEVAWPEKYPYKSCNTVCSHDGHLEEIRKTVGEHLWAALYQGRPRPEGTAIFHEPARFKLSEFTWAGKRGVIVIDPAATAKTSSDWTAMLVCAVEGFGLNSKMWIIDRIHVQEEIPQIVKIAHRLQRQYKLMIACEAVSGFKAVPQMLRQLDPSIRIMELAVHRDKFTRAQGLAAAWNDGRVMIPLDAEWADHLIEEYTRFTGNGDKHDDQVDCGAHAWNVLFAMRKPITEADYGQSGGM